MGDCQNYSPFLGPLNSAPYYNGDPKRDHNFDNPPGGGEVHTGGERMKSRNKYALTAVGFWVAETFRV